ncbi:UDP-N-acetylglucosamine transferase subunit ALG14 [Aestuariibacter sp. AA17]|uniref:UDP-N-acetylglucosamine transferase subunit ALG14 n=1 Tax=Fluctibacter corallii TaxID=2984329 RepID=A0ABT3A3U5_9ALTE|nr:PssD/Cps14F family polysaccharide biosynthesis glycosyltransferase [Aestuariibacter sp. AA17]MCV2883273.1 UDP-N-acetylglucosamine transferase subunit ALG14 [Aestuariibacter sp. AA17]
MKNSKEKAVLLVYGMGGHEEQMRRLTKSMPALSNSQYIAYTDAKRHDLNVAAKYIFSSEMRDKHDNQSIWISIKRIITAFRAANVLFGENQITLVLSTGPGHAVIPAIIARLKGVKVIHLETWSRFTTRSLTGRLMYYIANEFWVQHTHLQPLYPKAKYVGLL